MAKSVDELWIGRRRASQFIRVAGIILALTVGFWAGFGLRQYQENVNLNVQERRYLEIVDALGSCGGKKIPNARRVSEK